MCTYLLGEHIKGLAPDRSAFPENVLIYGIKKRELCEKFPLDVNQTSFQLTYEHTSKDSQFLEVL